MEQTGVVRLGSGTGYEMVARSGRLRRRQRWVSHVDSGLTRLDPGEINYKSVHDWF